jgi:hypothetical protein
MTDNQRHERLAVLHERCRTCRHAGVRPQPWHGATLSCGSAALNSTGLATSDWFWLNSNVVASVENWNITLPEWWVSHARPAQCVTMSEQPCPSYERST